MSWTRHEAQHKKGDPEMELKARAPEPLGPQFSRELVAKADELRILRTQAAERVLSHTYLLLKMDDGTPKIIANKTVEY